MNVPDLIRRMNATEATLKRFRGEPFDWARGMHCARVLHFHLGKMKAPRPELPRLRSQGDAERELVRRGCKSMAGVMDQLGFEPIPPLAMLIGDVGYRRSPDGLGGILICAGATKMMGWFAQNEETGGRFCVGDFSFEEVEGAWRV